MNAKLSLARATSDLDCSIDMPSDVKAAESGSVTDAAATAAAAAAAEAHFAARAELEEQHAREMRDAVAAARAAAEAQSEQVSCLPQRGADLFLPPPSP